MDEFNVNLEWLDEQMWVPQDLLALLEVLCHALLRCAFLSVVILAKAMLILLSQSWVELHPGSVLWWEKGDWDRTQINSSTYLVASVGRRPRWTIDLVPEVQTKAGGVAGISAPYCIHSPSDNCPAYCQSLLNAAGKETALKNQQADFPLLLQSPFCCEKGSGAVYLETNGSLSGRRVLSFFPHTNHTVHITFFQCLLLQYFRMKPEMSIWENIYILLSW